MGAEGGGIVALLFTDLAGSTSMYDRLGDERAEELRRAHFAALRQALVTHGGREVKNLGDGLMVAFTSAVAAVDAAIAMQRSTNGREVRVGLHAGEPLRDEGDYFGVSVNIAKRLCDVAQPGQIFASGLIRALVSPRLRTGLRPVGALELKGIEDAVDAYEVEWAPAIAPSGVPPVLTASNDAPLVGRSAELEALTGLWSAASSGARRVALVSGEPGIGKTRLVRELARHAARDGRSLLLAGRSDPELVVPLEPFAEAFRAALTTWPPESGALLATAALEPLLRAAGTRSGVADTERSQLFGAVVDLLGAAQEVAPVLLVLDDVHWADETSLLLLRQLLRDPCPRLLVVVTYRDTEVGRRHPLANLLADLRREEGVERFALRGLDRQGVRSLLGAEGADADALAERIHDETEGNPFFATEVLRHLTEQGRLRRRVDGGVDVVGVPESIDVPEGIREVVGRRLSRLSEGCNGLLAVAAVIGRHFGARLLADVEGASVDRVLDGIDEAMTSGLIVSDEHATGTFAFSHALVRETLLAELSPVQRMRLHHAIATALAERDDAIAEVAHHLIEAGPVGDARAMGEAAARAAHDARFRLAAFEDAARIARRALALLGSEHEDLRCDLLTVLGDSLIASSDIGGLESLREAATIARRLRDPERIARPVSYALRAGVPTPDMPPFVEAADDALSLLPDQPTVTRARLRAVLTLSQNNGERLEAERLTAQVLAEAEEAGDAEAIIYAALARVDVLLALGRADEAGDVLDVAFEAITDGLHEALMPHGTRCFERALILGDRRLAEETMEMIAANSRRFDNDVWTDELPRASFALLDGRLDDAVRHATTVLGGRLNTLQAMAMLFLAAVERDEGASLIAAVQEQVVTSGLAAWSAGLSLLLAEAGRVDEARTAAAGVVAQLDRELGSAVGLAVMADVASSLGDRDLASALLPQLDRFAGLTATAGVISLGAADRYRALCLATLGDDDAALALLDAADVVNERIGARLHRLHATVDRGALYLRRGAGDDVAEARDLLGRTAAEASASGLHRVARRAGAALGGRAAPVFD